jgi:plastocyanin
MMRTLLACLRSPTERRWLVFSVVTLAVGIGLLAGPGGPASFLVRLAGAAEPGQVAIDNYSFSPSSLTVPVGTTVTWVNHDETPHTVVSGDDPRLFKSGGLDTDDSFSFTFTKPGTYSYLCTVHPYMTGKITVK